MLLVDDNEDITSTLMRGLELQGFKVDAFNRPASVPVTAANDCDIAILDIRMPEISGFELARELWRKNEKL